jgi:hypothetical protein
MPNGCIARKSIEVMSLVDLINFAAILPYEQLSIAQGSHAGRVIAAIFEAFQPLKDNRGGWLFATIANDTTHLSFP